jgi:hypothetical protein
MITRVVNINSGEPYDVYIGRGSRWGNPFIVGVHGSREECIEQFKQMLKDNKELLDDLYKLEGKVLGCYCKPKPCHGDIYCDILNRRSFSL